MKKVDKEDFPRKFQYAFQFTKILKTYTALDIDEKSGVTGKRSKTLCRIRMILMPIRIRI
jgi:hypothetical protein